jgi:dinuclear metal center YbgI/SA1388 family protein
MPHVSDICRFLEAFAPTRTAAEWDNVGLLLGEASDSVDRVLTCLTVTPNVVAEAVRERVQLIVTHHPILFRGAKKLSSETSEGRLLLPLMKVGIAVYSPHTAFDNCRNGINDSIAQQLGLSNIVPLRRAEPVKQVKLVVFVPEQDRGKVTDAIFGAGGGKIGAYEQCSFRIPGTGTFFGTENTNPAVGQKGQREEVAEVRLEVILPESALSAVLRAMRSAHSYEEPAFDVYPLIGDRKSVRDGEGRLGECQPTQLDELARKLKQNLNASGVQVCGSLSRGVRKIAIACGAAGEFLSDAIREKADVFITGEMRFHDLLRAEASDIALLLPGHYATERPAVEALAEKLSSGLPGLHVFPSQDEHDPLNAWV